jgi:hypothetical protein
MDVTSDQKNKTQKLLKFLKTHYLKMGFIVSGLMVLTVYQNCSSPAPDLSQYSGSSVTPPAALGIVFTDSTVKKVCTLPASAISTGGADVSLTATGGNANSFFIFSLSNFGGNTSPGSIIQPQVGNGNPAIYHSDYVVKDTPVTVYVKDTTTGNIGSFQFTVGPKHAQIIVTANSNFTVPDCADGASLTVEAWGGGGGGGGNDSFSGASGGGGGYAKNSLLATKGDSFNVSIGGGGSPGITASCTGGGAGAISGNGGNGSKAGCTGSSGGGGGGGGYSKVVFNRTNISPLDLLYAGGGGGGGGGGNSISPSSYAGAGGAGGQNGFQAYDFLSQYSSAAIFGNKLIGFAGISGASTTIAGDIGHFINVTCEGLTVPIFILCDAGGSGGGGGGHLGGSGGSSGFENVQVDPYRFPSGSPHGAGGGGGSSFAASLGQAQEATAAGNGVTPANANLIPTSAPATNNAKGGASAQAGSSGLIVITW